MMHRTFCFGLLLLLQCHWRTTFAFFPRAQSVLAAKRAKVGNSNGDRQGDGSKRGGGMLRRPPSLSELFSAGSDDDDDSDDSASGNVSATKTSKGPAPVSAFEDMVRKMTNNPDYHFGDLTKTAAKTAVSAGTHVVEDVVHRATGKDDYQFGDITKGTISKVSKTGTNVLTYSEKTLALMREANIHELVELTKFFWTQNMNEVQRKETFVVMIYLGAVLVLAYNFVANINAGLVNAVAYHMASVKLGASPLAAGAGGWDVFLRAQKTLDMVFGGPFLPARVAITIPIFFNYQHWIRGLGARLPLRGKYPILNRIASLVIMWVMVNLATYSVVSVGFAWLASLVSGVPLR